jgi:hypothetical protein
MYKTSTKAIMITLMAITMAGAAVMPVLAADEGEPDPAPAAQFSGDGVQRFFSGALARTFRYQKSMVVFIGEALESAEDSVVKASDRIAELEAAGKDVDMLEEAVAAFETLYEQAQADQQAALALVDAHVGFDLNGKVTDLAEARETVKAVEPFLSSARENIIDAMQTIANAMREFRDTNQE